MRSPYILIVDDEEYHLSALTTLLEAHGYLTASVYSSSEALELMRHHLPDLILCDINMPGQNGLEFCTEIKSHRRFREVPLVFCSAMSRDADVEAGLAAGACDFIPKPVDIYRLLNAVQNHHATLV
jgi:CheY-like chemotaxis protein